MREDGAYARYPHLTGAEIGIRHAWISRRLQQGLGGVDPWELQRLRVEMKARRARIRTLFQKDKALRRELLQQADPARWWDAKTFGRPVGEPPELWLGSRHWSIAELETFVDHSTGMDRAFATDLESSYEATLRRAVMETDAAREVRSAFLRSDGYFDPAGLPEELRERLLEAVVGVQERFDDFAGAADPLTRHRVGELLREAFVDAREAQIDAWNLAVQQQLRFDENAPSAARLEQAIVGAGREIVDVRLPASPEIARSLDRAIDAAAADFRRAELPELREQVALAAQRAENAAYSVSRLSGGIGSGGIGSSAGSSQLIGRARDIRDAQAALGEAYGMAKIWDRTADVSAARERHVLERLHLATRTAPNRIFRRLSKLIPQGRWVAEVARSIGRIISPEQRVGLEMRR